jgi:phytanoyl-CoA hydroxylase
MTAVAQASLVERFKKDGYVAIPGFIGPDEIGELQENVARFIREVVPTMPPEAVFYEVKGEAGSLKQLQKLFDYDAYFRTAPFVERSEQLAADLLENPVRAINLQYFDKPPGMNSPTPPHQDGYYFMLEPNEAVTMWLALDDVDEENGCVRYVRGSHRQGLRPHGMTKTLGFSQGLLDFGSGDDEMNAVAMPAKPGDLLVHHSLAVHWAEGNRSPERHRRSLGMVYFSSLAKEDLAGRDERQQQIHAEWKAAGKI